jgi:hypothetical protein
VFCLTNHRGAQYHSRGITAIKIVKFSTIKQCSVVGLFEQMLFTFSVYFQLNKSSIQLFCTMTNKCTIISQIITLLHVSTLSCHPQGACNRCFMHKTYVQHPNCKLYYQHPHFKCLCNLARIWIQAPWGWYDSVETCRSVIIRELIVRLLIIVENNKRYTIHVLK